MEMESHIETYNELADVLRAAGHPDRLAIMNLMCSHGCMPMNVKTIYESLGLQQSVVSRHLGILRRCGLLIKKGAGNGTCYLINDKNPVAVSMVNCIRQKT